MERGRILKKTKQLVWKLFEMHVPKCPAGGSYSLVYNRRAHLELPSLVCSMEQSRGHIDSNIAYHERLIAERARIESTVIHPWTASFSSPQLARAPEAS